MKRETNSYVPPSWAQSLLRWRCRQEDLEEAEGDLRELYAYWAETFGEREAKKRYILSAIRLQRLFGSLSKKNSSTPLIAKDMIQHYLTTALRNLTRSKTFSIINVTGLA